jgi:hypothetical protein
MSGMRSGLAAILWLAPLIAAAEDAPPSPAAAPGALEARLAALEARLAEVDAATTSLATASDAAREPAFRLYGFIDMGLQRVWAHDDVVLPTRKTTFVLGNINLYLDFHPATDWRALVELRLTNYPAGTEQYGVPLLGVPYTRTSATSPDPGNGDGYDTVRWGALVLERAYLQWQHDPRLGVRVGQFLTPYGIWNVDHGTPTLIALYRPQAQSNEMFPQHQLGIELYGRLAGWPAPRWQLDYHAYVSNGRTQGVVALTDDKMVGGRAVISTLHPVPMSFGVSAMRGRFVDQQHNVNAQTGATERPDVVMYEERALGIDASVDLGALRLRGEAAVRHKAYGFDQRDQWSPGVYVADGDELDAYAIAAYRIPATRFEPYAYGELYQWPTPVGEHLALGSLGVNTYFTPAIQLKLQALYSTWLDGRPTFGKPNADEVFLAAKLVMGL